MIKYLIPAAFLMTFLAYGQTPVQNNNAVSAATYTAIGGATDFSYFSKNYEKVFGEYTGFTFKTAEANQWPVYSAFDAQYSYKGNNSFFMNMPFSAQSFTANNSYLNPDVAGFVKGLKGIIEMEKDYSIKNRQ